MTLLDQARQVFARPGLQAWLWAFLAIALVRGTLFVLVVPPWQHPDEPTHFEHVRLIAQMGRLPAADSVSLPLRREIAQSMLEHRFWRGIQQPPLDDASLSTVGTSPIGIYTLTQPRLYYVAAALWLRPWLRLGLPVEGQLAVVRMLSVALNLVVVVCAFCTSRILYPQRSDLALGVLGFVVFQPTLTDIMSAVNNDALVNAFGAIFFLTLAWVFRRGWSWRGVLLILLSVTGAILTKSTGLVLAGLVPLALAAYPWPGRWGRLRNLALAAILGAVTLAAWGFSAGWLDGRSLGGLVPVLGQYLRMDVPGTWRSLTSPESLQTYYASAVVVFGSFWGVYGWRHLFLPASWYWLPGAATLLCLGGLGRRAALWLQQRHGTATDGRRGAYLALALAAVLLAWALAVARSQAVQGMRTYLSHGRYVLVAMVPFALLFTLGLQQWVPASRWRWGLALYWIALIAFDAAGFLGVLLPYYYG